MKMDPFRNGAAGVVSSAKLFRLEDFADLTTPPAALSVASQLLVGAAVSPPLRGGEYSTFNISSLHSHLGPRVLCGSTKYARSETAPTAAASLHSQLDRPTPATVAGIVIQL